HGRVASHILNSSRRYSTTLPAPQVSLEVCRPQLFSPHGELQRSNVHDHRRRPPPPQDGRGGDWDISFFRRHHLFLRRLPSGRLCGRIGEFFGTDLCADVEPVGRGRQYGSTAEDFHRGESRLRLHDFPYHGIFRDFGKVHYWG